MKKKLEFLFTNTIKLCGWIILSLTLFLITNCNSNTNVGNKWVLWYEKPAGTQWTNALPIGNGRLGGMVFGNVAEERIQINEDTIWTGKKNWRNPNSKNAPNVLKKARKLLTKNKFQEAEKILQQEFLLSYDDLADKQNGYRAYGSYQTMGDLYLKFGNIQEKNISSYRRELNLDTAIATTTFQYKGVRYVREVFSSPVAQALVVRLTSSKKGSIDVDIALHRDTGAIINYKNNSITLNGQAQRVNEQTKYTNIPPFDKSFKNKQGLTINDGVTFDTFVNVQEESGKITTEKDKISVQGADAVTIYLTCGTDYWTKHYPNSAQKFDNSKKKALRDSKAIMKKKYEDVKQASIKSHRDLFQRVDISLGGSKKDNMPTDARLNKIIAAYQKEGSNPKAAIDNDLIALYLQYSRYLSIASSRPNTMPANLQGIWSYHYFAPWSADYHININLQMNYWHVYTLNLFETIEPYFNYIDRLVPSGTKTAKKFYGSKGWTSHHTSDAWLFTSPIGSLKWGFFPFSAAWNSANYWKYYLYTKDKKFLEQRAFPILKQASLFLLDYSFEDPKTGKLITGPSNSPENIFQQKGSETTHSISVGTSMGQLITLQTLENLVKTAEVLGKQNDSTVKQAKAAIDKIAFPKIDSLGRIMEWREEFKEPTKGHRHISHLYSLYPSSHFLEHEGYKEAARKSIEYRLQHGGGHTGWSRAWIINFWARLKDSKKAYENVMLLLAKSTLPNLLDTHPPFQIDGNFGGAAGIAETLIQSHLSYSKEGYDNVSVVELLPALPQQWGNGYFKGFRTPGSHTIDMQWKANKPTQVTLYTQSSKEKRLFVFTVPKNAQVKQVTDESGKTLATTIEGKGFIVLELPNKKKTISISF